MIADTQRRKRRVNPRPASTAARLDWFDRHDAWIAKHSRAILTAVTLALALAAFLPR